MDKFLRHQDGSEGASKTYTVYDYPFHEVPWLKSHIQPKFVIYNAGLKLAGMKRGSIAILRTALHNYPSLIKIMDIYTAWIEPLPEEAPHDTSFINPSDNLLSSEDELGNGGDDTKDGDYSDANRST